MFLRVATFGPSKLRDASGWEKQWRTLRFIPYAIVLFRICLYKTENNHKSLRIVVHAAFYGNSINTYADLYIYIFTFKSCHDTLIHVCIKYIFDGNDENSLMTF